MEIKLIPLLAGFVVALIIFWLIKSGQSGKILSWFPAKKATWIDVESLRGTVASHSVDLRCHYAALKSQKKMLDLVMDYLNIEPVTTTTVIGVNSPDKDTVTKLRKKVKSKAIKKEEGEYDD